jgi:hypothetical protein
MQYEAPSAHLLSWHSREQHSLPSVQGLPAVLQPTPSVAQVPSRQEPLQQASSRLQVCPSATQAVAAQCPPTHESEQQSVPTEQAVSTGLQLAIADLQVPEPGSQIPEQQAMSVTQVAPEARHSE